MSIAKAVSHPATPQALSHSRALNLDLALPHALPLMEDFARTAVSHYPVFSAKGWLSLNWIRGCSLECAYCFRPAREVNAPIQKVYEEQFVVDYLLRHPYFVPKLPNLPSEFLPTVIGLHTSSTDPFLPAVKENTFRMLELLDQSKINNTVVVISKLPLNEQDIDRLKETIKNIHLLIMLCYSNMGSNIECSSTPEVTEKKNRFLDSINGLSPHIEPIHYYRPIAMGWNDTDEQIAHALMFGDPSRAIIAGGLTLWYDEINYLLERGIDIPPGPAEGWTGFGYRRKFFPKSLEGRILEIKDGLGIQTPLFRRASCGISYVDKISDYNGYRTEDKKNCTISCPNEQRGRCEAVVPPKEQSVRRAFEKMGIDPTPRFEITEKGIRVEFKDNHFHLLDAFALRHLLGFPVEKLELR